MNQAEFRDAFLAHKDVLFRFAYRMTGSEETAEDLVQEAFLVLWRRPDGYDSGRGTLRSFLLGITRNLALKRLRDQRPHEPLETETFVCLPFDLAGMRRDQAVAQAVAALPALQREVLVLAEYEELALAEIAAATGAELAAVKSRLFRARENLRKMLAPLLESRGALI